MARAPAALDRLAPEPDGVIRRLRVRHRWVFVVLALLLPATVAAGLLGRPAPPVVKGPELLPAEAQVGRASCRERV